MCGFGVAVVVLLVLVGYALDLVGISSAVLC